MHINHVAIPVLADMMAWIQSFREGRREQTVEEQGGRENNAGEFRPLGSLFCSSGFDKVKITEKAGNRKRNHTHLLTVSLSDVLI